MRFFSHFIFTYFIFICCLFALLLSLSSIHGWCLLLFLRRMPFDCLRRWTVTSCRSTSFSWARLLPIHAYVCLCVLCCVVMCLLYFGSLSCAPSERSSCRAGHNVLFMCECFFVVVTPPSVPNGQPCLEPFRCSLSPHQHPNRQLHSGI